jgi:hypothetical protein
MSTKSTRDRAAVAAAITAFARRAAESRIIAIRGLDSTSVPTSDTLSIESADDAVPLVGRGQDAAFADPDVTPRVEAALATGSATLVVEGQRFPLHDVVEAGSPTGDVLILSSMRSARPGPVGRMVLIVDRSAGVVVA